MATFTLVINLDEFTGVAATSNPLLTISANAEVFEAGGPVFEKALVRLVDGTSTVTLPAKAVGTTPADWTYTLHRKGRAPIYVPAQTVGTYNLSDVMEPTEAPPVGWQGAQGPAGPAGPAGANGEGLPANVVTRTTAYTAAVGDFVQADTTSAGFTVTLPTAPATGSLVGVKKISADTNTLTIAAAGGGTIDGSATATTITNNAGVTVRHVGSNVWRVVASMSTTGPAGTNGTNASLSIIEDEGSALGQRATMNFVGAGVTVTDTGSKTVVTIPGASAAGGRPFRVGRVTTPCGGVANNLALNSGSEYLMPFDVIGAAITVTDIGINVFTASAGSVIRLGVRADSSGSPGAVVLSAAATVDSSTTGFKETAFSTTLAPGSYWLCARATGGGNPIVYANTGVPFVLPGAAIGAGLSTVISGYSDSGGGSGAISGTFTVAFGEDKGPRILLKTV